jgi:hypothetical protein
VPRRGRGDSQPLLSFSLTRLSFVRVSSVAYRGHVPAAKSRFVFSFFIAPPLSQGELDDTRAAYISGRRVLALSLRAERRLNYLPGPHQVRPGYRSLWIIRPMGLEGTFDVGLHVQQTLTNPTETSIVHLELVQPGPASAYSTRRAIPRSLSDRRRLGLDDRSRITK